MSDSFRIYDIERDEMRLLTATDLAILQAVNVAYGRLREMVEATHAELMREISKIRGRGGQPNEPGVPVRQVIDTGSV